MMEYRNLRIALLGAGSVGSQVASLLLEHGDAKQARFSQGAHMGGGGLGWAGLAWLKQHLLG